eukprot:scaffold1167_cov418-Prasinococcus_capsulatus_cf.AAC.3
MAVRRLDESSIRKLRAGYVGSVPLGRPLRRPFKLRGTACFPQCGCWRDDDQGQDSFRFLAHCGRQRPRHAAGRP